MVDSARPNYHKQKRKPKSALNAQHPRYSTEGTLEKFNSYAQAAYLLLGWHQIFPLRNVLCFSATLNRSREEHNSSAFQASKGVFPASSYAKASCTLQGIRIVLFSSSHFFRDSVLYRSFSGQTMTHLNSAVENRFQLTEKLLLRAGKKLEYKPYCHSGPASGRG